MATLNSVFTINDLKTYLISEVRRELGNVVPLVERIASQEPVDKGTKTVRKVIRARIGKMYDVDTAAYPATAGYKPVTPTVGPILEYGATGKAIFSSVYNVDEFHHGQRSLVVSDIAKAAANELNRHAIARLEGALTKSVTYTQGDGTSRTSNLFAVSGSPWYTKAGTAVSNVVSAALSASSLDTAITRRQTAINWEDDTPMNPPMANNMFLFVPPALRSLAEIITGAPALPLTTLSILGDSVTGDVMNVLTKHNIVPVVVPDFSSATAAYLVDGASMPMSYAVFTPLDLEVVQKAAPQAYEISATMEIGAELNPYEFGAIRIAA